MVGTSDKKYWTLAEIAKEAGLSMYRVHSHRYVGSFPAIKKGIRWIVLDSDAREFIRLAKRGELPGRWEAIEQRYKCEELQKGISYLSLWQFSEKLGVRYETVLKRIDAGQIEGWWFENRWWIPKVEYRKQVAVKDFLAEKKAEMLGTKRPWCYTLREVGAEAWLSEGRVRDHLRARTFAAIKTNRGWVVPNASAEEFIRRSRSRKLPGIWDATQKACMREERPKDVITYSLQKVARQLNVSNRAILKGIGAGEIEAYYVGGNWWVSEFVGGKQRKVGKQQRELSTAKPCFVADKELEGFFFSGKDLEFVDCGAFTVDSLVALLRKNKPKAFFFGKQMRLQNGINPMDLQASCENVCFTQIQGGETP